MISKSYLSTLSATGASQTPLEGNALASGCAGCDGDGVYATITKALFNANWYDTADGLIIEDAVAEVAATAGYRRQLVVYAFYHEGAPKQIDSSKLQFEIEPNDGLTISDTGLIEGEVKSGVEYVITVTAKGKEALKGVATIVGA